jgi:Protein of unknown function (DUF3575)
MNLTSRGFWGIALLAMLWLVPHGAFGQDEPDSLRKYFDDNGLSTRKNIISTNLLAPISGLVGLRYERAISHRMSIELGVQKVMPFYLYELILPLNDLVNNFEPKGGISLSLSPHFYFWDKAPEFHYMGPRYAFRNYNMIDGSTLQVHDVTVEYGYNLFLSKRFMFCYGIGGGARHLRAYDAAATPSAPRLPTEKFTFIVMTWSIGLGVMF